MLITRARLLGRDDLVDIAVRESRIERVEPKIHERAAEAHDLAGKLVLPGFVDSHLHLDKAFLLEQPGIDPSQMKTFFATLREFKRREAKPSMLARMRRALEWASRHGTTTVRAQIDVDAHAELRALQAALELREQVSEWMDLEVVAFPQEGLLRNPAVGNMVREAMKLGADVIGGGAALDTGSMKEHIDAVFALAEEFDCDVDLHSDLSVSPDTPPESWELAYIVQKVREMGWQNRVSVAHQSALNQMPLDQVKRVIDMLLEGGISVTIAPSAELHIARAWQSPPAHNARQVLTDLESLIAGGVNVSFTTGHVRDGINPYGNADMLLEALVLTCAYGLGEPVIAGTDALKLATENPARALRLPDYGIQPGCPADLVAMDAQDAVLAVRHVPERALVMKAGRVIAQKNVDG